MATHSSILASRIPWTKEPGGLQFMGSQSVKQLCTCACIGEFNMVETMALFLIF